MNQSIKNISVPKPCAQNWADMDIFEQGRFCQNCQKTVVDFTKLSNEQVLQRLSSSDKVCGRFEDTQLNMLNEVIVINPLKSRFSWKRVSVAVAAFISLTPFIKIQAKSKPIIECQALSNKNFAGTVPP